MRRILFIGMLAPILWSTFVSAEKTDAKKIKIAKCEIKGSKPIRGGERCDFFDDHVVVYRCHSTPCKIPLDSIKENSFFKCEDKGKDPAPPSWVNENEARRHLVGNLKTIITDSWRDLDKLQYTNMASGNPKVVRVFAKSNDEFAEAKTKIGKLASGERFQKSLTIDLVDLTGASPEVGVVRFTHGKEALSLAVENTLEECSTSVVSANSKSNKDEK